MLSKENTQEKRDSKKEVSLLKRDFKKLRLNENAEDIKHLLSLRSVKGKQAEGAILRAIEANNKIVSIAIYDDAEQEDIQSLPTNDKELESWSKLLGVKVGRSWLTGKKSEAAIFFEKHFAKVFTAVKVYRAEKAPTDKDLRTEINKLKSDLRHQKEINKAIATELVASASANDVLKRNNEKVLSFAEKNSIEVVIDQHSGEINIIRNKPSLRSVK